MMRVRFWRTSGISREIWFPMHTITRCRVSRQGVVRRAAIAAAFLAVLMLSTGGAFAQSRGSAAAPVNDSGAAFGDASDPFNATGAPGATPGDDSTRRGPAAAAGPRVARDCADVADPYSVDEDFAAQMRDDCLAEQGGDSANGIEDSTTFSEGLTGPAGAKGALGRLRPGGRGLDSRSASAMIGRLGLSPDEFNTLKSQMASGALDPDDIQELCLRFSARQLSPTDIDGIAKSLGLGFTSQQLQQLRSCTQLAEPEPGTGPATTTGPREAGARRLEPQKQTSSIERSFRGLDTGAPPAAPTTKNLEQFGYSLFSQRVSTFAPVTNVPVGNDYVIGPDDNLKVLLWGRFNKTLSLTVGRDGSLLVPEIGPLQVAGLTFEQAKKLIEERAGQITGVKVEVTMGKLRTIQVFVVGEVEQPGAYTVSALSRISNALGSAGGITKIGSLRRIELRRGNQIVKVIDLYQLLLSGNANDDDRLQASDVIFVPVIGPVAGVVGDVKRPAIYEIAGQGAESLGSFVKLAGGISAYGYRQRVQVERVQEHQKRVALDVDFTELSSQGFKVLDGDLVRVYPVLPEQRDVVAIKGNINRPGKFQYREGMKIADLVAQAEGVAPRTFFKYALVRRKEGPGKQLNLVAVDLSAALSGASNANLTLQPEDELTIYSETQMKQLPTVQVFGEVRNPGFYVLSQGMKVSDLVYLAGGLKDNAFMRQAELARTQVVNGARTSHTFRDLNLGEALAGVETQNASLEANDQLFVRRATDWHLPWIVHVRGQVGRPGPYTVRNDERIATVIQRSGGLLGDAYLPATVLIRQSVKKLQQQRLDEARGRLRQAIARLQLMPESARGKSNKDQSGQETAMAMAMLEKLLSESESEQAQGRVVIHLRPLDELAKSPDNIVLVDQDVLTIPRRPAAVNVLGEVYSPNAIVWKPGLNTRDYLDLAGGPAEGADAEHIMVIKADGSVLTEDAINSRKEARMFPLLPVVSGGLMTAQLEPGDTVYVPQKLIYIDKMQVASTITQIFANTASTLAVVGLLATNVM